MFKLLHFHRKKIFVLRCRAIMLYKMTNNNSVSTGLILLTPTVGLYGLHSRTFGQCSQFSNIILGRFEASWGEPERAGPKLGFCFRGVCRYNARRNLYCPTKSIFFRGPFNFFPTTKKPLHLLLHRLVLAPAPPLSAVLITLGY